MVLLYIWVEYESRLMDILANNMNFTFVLFFHCNSHCNYLCREGLAGKDFLFYFSWHFPN